jgi:multiple antibiotic resistance protein
VPSGGAHRYEIAGQRLAVKFFLDVFVTLFVIIDPAGTVPVFLGLTRGRSLAERGLPLR